MKIKTDPAYVTYIQYRNLYNRLKRTAKQTYYEQRFNMYKNDLKRTWKMLNSLIRHKSDKSSIQETFKHDNQVISNKNIIAEQFCDYFSNVGPNLSKDIKVSEKDHDHYLQLKRSRNPNSMFLLPTHPEEIRKIIDQRKSKNSSGHDNISTSFIKQIGAELAWPVSILTNKSLLEGTVPDQLKIAKIKPIYKSKENDLFSNYRPISLLPALSKIVEKVMYNRIYNFFEHSDLFYESQYGFRKKHSTTQAVLEFISHTVEALENKKSTLSVFLDLSKAFDTINHKILLEKLNFYGVRGIAYDWIKSYLENRTHYVDYLGTTSEHKPITCGVPQGSILGPLLFIIYINDLNHSLTLSKSILFADDTTIFQSSDNIKELYSNMNKDLAKLGDWFRANKLSLNVSKSNYILFTNIHIPDIHTFVLKMGKDKIEKKKSVKSLGIIIDEKLTWNEHIKVCKTKISNSVYAINRVKHLIPRKYIRTLYFTMVYPYLTYGIPLWGSTYDTHKKKLVLMQKRMIRIIEGAKYNEHTNPLFCKTGILKMDDIYKVETLKLVFKYLNNELPTPLRNLFTPNTAIYERQTRQHSDLHVKKCRTTIAAQSISGRGPQLWNVLPNSLKTLRAGTITIFVSNLVKHIVQAYNLP
jgi:hypothetical protein